MNYSDTLKNPHFQNLAAIIRKPFWSKKWRQAHADVPFWQLLDDISTIMDVNSTEATVCFCKLFVALTVADSSLSYSEDDLTWLIEKMNGAEGSAVASLLLAYASAPKQ